MKKKELSLSKFIKAITNKTKKKTIFFSINIVYINKQNTIKEIILIKIYNTFFFK